MSDISVYYDGKIVHCSLIVLNSDFFATLPLDTDTGNTNVLNETLELIDEAENVSISRKVMVLAYANYTVRVQTFIGSEGGESTDIIILSPQAGMFWLLSLFLISLLPS